jgi:hypothetical protein
MGISLQLMNLFITEVVVVVVVAVKNTREVNIRRFFRQLF